MSTILYYTHSLYYEKRNRLLNEAEELIDQIHSTNGFDEKFIK